MPLDLSVGRVKTVYIMYKMPNQVKVSEVHQYYSQVYKIGACNENRAEEHARWRTVEAQIQAAKRGEPLEARDKEINVAFGYGAAHQIEGL